MVIFQPMIEIQGELVTPSDIFSAIVYQKLMYRKPNIAVASKYELSYGINKDEEGDHPYFQVGEPISIFNGSGQITKFRIGRDGQILRGIIPIEGEINPKSLPVVEKVLDPAELEKLFKVMENPDVDFGYVGELTRPAKDELSEISTRRQTLKRVALMISGDGTFILRDPRKKPLS